MCPSISPKACPMGPDARAICRRSRTPARAWPTWWSRRWRDGKFPLVLGGDHSVAIGTVAGMSQHFRKAGQKLGLIWIDAHADMNTPGHSPSGNVHGMPLACCIGLGPRELTSIFGLRSKVDPRNVASSACAMWMSTRSRNVRGAGVHAFTMRDIDERGLRAVMQEAIEIATDGTAGFHLSFDMDAVDPRRSARRRHARARRHHLPRGASGDGNDLRLRRMLASKWWK